MDGTAASPHSDASADPVAIHGECNPHFAELRARFAAGFDSRGDGKGDAELGAAVAVALRGRLEVDLWGGFADEARSRPWQRDTLVNVYSVTKGITATCIHRLVEQGVLELDAEVARYWPEFAAAGKAGITLRQLLCHQAGLAGIREKIPYERRYDARWQATALAEQEPWWEPGLEHGYHAVTFGTLLGELVERVDGRTLGCYFREEIAELAGIDFHIGLSEDEFARCADIVQPEPKGRRPRRREESSNAGPGAHSTGSGSSGPADADARKRGAGGFSNALQRNRQSLLGKAFANPAVPLLEANTPAWRRAELPAHGGHGSAAALALFYSALASGGTLAGVSILRPETIENAIKEHAFGRDAVLAPLKTRFGLGFMLASRGIPMGPGRASFGHPGYGGAIAFADPERGVGFAYVMNRMQAQLMGGARGSRLVEALYEGLELEES